MIKKLLMTAFVAIVVITAVILNPIRTYASNPAQDKISDAEPTNILWTIENNKFYLKITEHNQSTNEYFDSEVRQIATPTHISWTTEEVKDNYIYSTVIFPDWSSRLDYFRNCSEFYLHISESEEFEDVTSIYIDNSDYQYDEDGYEYYEFTIVFSGKPNTKYYKK